METPVQIDGPRGRLFGIVHEAVAGNRSQTCVIMLSGGQAPRFGPQRLYVNAARNWAARGMRVLRVDLSGVGDALADNSEIHLDNHAESDVSAVVAFARDRLGVEQIVLHGLCGGARVAARYAARDTTVAALLLWSCPLFTVNYGSSAPRSGEVLRMNRSRARHTLHRVAQALRQLQFLSPSWWRWAMQNIRSFSRDVLASVAQLARPDPSQRSSSVTAIERCIAAGVPLQFIYGSLDRAALAELTDRFPQIPRDVAADQGFWVIEDGTHIFNTVAAQAEAIAVAGTWLEARLGRAPARRSSAA